MKILIPVLNFGPEGGYRVLSELANAWIKLGHECTFLVPATSGDPYFPTNGHIIRCSKKGVEKSADFERKATGADNILSLFAGLRKIGSNYDIIVANHCLTAWPVRWANCGKAIKFYYIQAYEPGYYPALHHPTKHVLARLSYLLRLTQISNSSSYKGSGINPVEVIPPGIDLSIFRLKEAPFSKSPNDEIILGTIGRTEPYKGTATALAAYRNLRKTNPSIRMKVGFGNVEPADDIEVVDIKGDEALAAYYRSLDVLIVSCYSQEGAPHYPLIEAMASGTPVVQTGYYPGNKDNTWLCKSHTVSSVTAALNELLSATQREKNVRIKAARKCVETELGWNQVAQRFVSVFQASLDKS